MLICSNPYCQAENPEGSYYCGSCGHHLAHEDDSHLEHSQFCRTCGARRERYPSDPRLATILFADVHGYTAMSEKLNDPERVTDLMNDCFTRLTRRIVEMGGSIDKYSGDNVMARFGAPVAHEDDPERAVRAALGMQEELIKFSTELQQSYGVELEMRIGINTGMVLAGEVGGLVDGVSYRTYTVMGDTVNLASRLEHEARVGHILVSQETYELSKHAFDFADLGLKQIRGKREPIHCFEVRGPKMQRQNRRGLAGFDIPVLGRDAELEIIWCKLEAVLAGVSQIVSVTGEAGVGKSSLLREFKKRLSSNQPDAGYLSGAAYSYASGQYFGLLRNVLLKLCKINDNDDEETSRRQLFSTIALLMGENNREDSPEYGQYAALLGRVLGLNLPNPVVDNLEPQQRSTLLTEALADFLLRRSETRPLVLVLDDLHWADTESLLVIDQLIHKLLGKGENGLPYSVLLLLLHRPEFVRNWPIPPGAGDRLTAVPLERLNPVQVEAVARQFLNTWFVREKEFDENPGQLNPLENYLPPIPLNAPLPAVLKSVLERANGNAFFIEEILKSLLDAGKIVAAGPDLTFIPYGEDSVPESVPEIQETWKVLGDLHDFKLPETLQEMLFARIDRLVGYNKQVLQIASVIGTRFEQRILVSVEDLNNKSDRVEQALDELLGKDLIYTAREMPDPEYSFRHALTREVAYSNLLAARRRVYHEQIGRAIERYKPDRLQDYTVVDDLAYHFKESADDEKALFYLSLAGHMRKSLYRNDEALQAFDEARQRLERRIENSRRLPLDEEKRQLVDFYSNIGDLLVLKTDYQGALDHYLKSLDLCTVQEIRLELWARLIEVNSKLGEFEQALEAFEKASSEFSTTISSSVSRPRLLQSRARLLYQIGWVYDQQGRYEDAVKAHTESLELLEAAQYPAEDESSNLNLKIDKGRAFNALGTVYEKQGDLQQAEKFRLKAAVLHQEARKLDLLARVYLGLATISITKGDLVKAEQHLKLARDNAQQAGDVEVVLGSNGNLGLIFERQGRLNYALKCYDAVANSPNPSWVAQALLYSGRILLQQGHFEEALTRFKSGLEYASSIGLPEVMAEAYNNLGIAYLITKNRVNSRLSLDAGLEKSRTINNPEYLFYSYLNRAELAFEQGDLEQAKAELCESARKCDELGDPLLRGQFLRMKGRIALQAQEFDDAAKDFNDSLVELESLKAFLEMSYTKLYLAYTLWYKSRQLAVQGQETSQLLRQVRSLLNQAVITFEACEVTVKQDETDTLNRLLESVYQN